MNLVGVALTLKDDIQFFHHHSSNPTLFAALQANTVAINNVFAILFDYKTTLPKEEYDFLVINSEIFKKFDEAFLQEATKIEMPVQKPRIYLPGQ